MLKNSRGNAIIEIVPILAIFVLILNFSLGFFGLIHSGILNSIGARNYAFETFRNRPNLEYLRDVVGSDNGFTYAKSQIRFHAIKTEGQSVDPSKFQASRRPIQFSEIRGVAEEKIVPNRTIFKNIMEGQRASETNIDEGVNPAWVKVTYGICLQANCGG